MQLLWLLLLWLLLLLLLVSIHGAVKLVSRLLTVQLLPARVDQPAVRRAGADRECSQDGAFSLLQLWEGGHTQDARR